MMNIIFASDDNFAMQAGIAMISLFENNRNADFTVYFLIDNFSEKNKQKINSIFNKYSHRLIFIEVGEYLAPLFQNFPSLSKSYLAYARLFIDCLLPAELERVLYLDCDILVRGDISELYFHKFEASSLLACCIDPMDDKHKEIIGLSRDSLYFNSGVTVFNLKRIRETGYGEKLKTFISDVQFKPIPLLYHDQDILNIVFEEKIDTLPVLYNVMSPMFYFRTIRNLSIASGVRPALYYSQEDLNIAVKNPVICHFTRDSFFIRPWYKKSNHIYYQEYIFFQNISPWVDFAGYDNTDNGLHHRLLIIASSLLPNNLFARLWAIVWKVYFRIMHSR